MFGRQIAKRWLWPLTLLIVCGMMTAMTAGCDDSGGKNKSGSADTGDDDAGDDDDGCIGDDDDFGDDDDGYIGDDDDFGDDDDDGNDPGGDTNPVASTPEPTTFILFLSATGVAAAMKLRRRGKRNTK